MINDHTDLKKNVWKEMKGSKRLKKMVTYKITTKRQMTHKFRKVTTETLNDHKKLRVTSKRQKKSHIGAKFK